MDKLVPFMVRNYPLSISKLSFNVFCMVFQLWAAQKLKNASPNLVFLVTVEVVLSFLDLFCEPLVPKLGVAKSPPES